MKKVSNVLDNILNNYGFTKKILETKVLYIWNKIVGESISQHTKAINIRYGKLLVEVDDPMWSYELTFHKNQIIKKLNEELKSEVVKEINLIWKKP